MHERSDDLVVQKDALPTRKMEGVGVAGAAVTVLVFIASLFDFPLTVDVASAVVTLITAAAAFAAGYFRHERVGTVSTASRLPPTTSPSEM